MEITWWVQRPNIKHGWKFWNLHKWKEIETGRKAYTFFFIFFGITFYI